MNFTSISLGIIFFLNTVPCTAEDLIELGNGGAGVLCTDKNSQQELVFFDYYEAKELHRNLSLLKSTVDAHMINADGELLQIKKTIIKLVSRFRTFDPEGAKKILNEMNTFFNENKTLYSRKNALPKGFGRTSDLRSEIHLPKNCSIKQIVVQYDEKISNGIKYIVDKELFNQLNTLNKVIAILHELIYSWYIEEGLSGDSSKVRKLLYFIIAIPFEFEFTDAPLKYPDANRGYLGLYREYIDLSISNKIPYITISSTYHTNFLAENPRFHVTTLDTTTQPTFCPNDRLKSFKTRNYKIFNYNLSVSGKVQIHCSTGVIKSGEITSYDYIELPHLNKKCFKQLNFSHLGVLEDCI